MHKKKNFFQTHCWSTIVIADEQRIHKYMHIYYAFDLQPNIRKCDMQHPTPDTLLLKIIYLITNVIDTLLYRMF